MKSEKIPIRLQNTLTGEKKEFKPLKEGEVSMYNCGPTVYGEQHIGNLSMFVFTDILRRTMEYNGLAVHQVINFTDIGHLSGDNDGDADTGEDRMTKGLKREGMDLTLENMKVLGKKYADIFLADLSELNINIDNTQFPFASDFVQEQIELVKRLEEKGFTYTGKDGVYFDTAKFPEYGKLGNIDLAGLKEGARVHTSDDKKNITDFLVWKFDEKFGWETSWGKGFPGWHIECSAMIFKLLGEQIDVHTGGIEHIPVHHNNEIAQSEAASGKKPFSRFWLHRSHVRIEDEKIAKSTGHVLYLSDLIKKGYDPLAYRYLLLTASYRTATNFTWEALEGAQTALKKLRKILQQDGNRIRAEKFDDNALEYEQKFKSYINDDLDTPKALALIWEMTKDTQVPNLQMRQLLSNFDSVLGLKLDQTEEITEIPENIRDLIQKRDKARAEKDFAKSDEIRKEIEALGFEVMDTPDGTKVEKI